MTQPDSSTIIRDVEMLLDQLYYWARRAQESRGRLDDERVAGRMLEVATAHLEVFVTTLLDCFRPLELARVPVPISDLISAIAIRARGEPGAAGVTVSGEANGIVSADVVHLTRALSGILRRLDSNGGRVDVAVIRSERGGRRGVEIALRSGAEAPLRTSRDGTAELEWVLALRIIALHAGEVHEHAGPRARTITLFLPADL